MGKFPSPGTSYRWLIFSLREFQKMGIFTSPIVLRRWLLPLRDPRPKEFIKKSDVCHIFWDENVEGHLPHPGHRTLESLAKDIKGDDKDGFLTFLRKILCWQLEERPTAGELVYDECS
ncbi:hypothetical protein ACJ72_08111 [Emergomyces africanus]|uniref:Uncharacterized protein n=1 Tax=Emergomyces africanus TaxID=1955775 RepID=A0A1B7NLD9_9EURO|nr:hypothetical protein ACJ72_08111 [Emergomyces africanus]